MLKELKTQKLKNEQRIVDIEQIKGSFQTTDLNSKTRLKV